jgi:hypothetical protein
MSLIQVTGLLLYRKGFGFDVDGYTVIVCFTMPVECGIMLNMPIPRKSNLSIK